MHFNTSRLYAITPDGLETDILLAKAQQAIAGGIGFLQYRNKTASSNLRLEQASALLSLCRKNGIPLIINDFIDLCEQLDADGVHLGGTDDAIKPARARLGTGKIIGASCYNQLSLAQQAQADGASYIAFGACFPTAVKPNAPIADLSLFAEQLAIPKVAIGGITPQNIHLIKHADAVAMIGAIYHAENITKATQQLNGLFQPFN